MALLNDPAAVAGLMTREVRTGEREGTPTRIAIARRDYRTDQADLWNALTDRDRIPRWFLPVSGDLAVGGRYQLEGNAGGTVQECRPPQRFSVTWEMGPAVSWLQITLTPVESGTTLELRHEMPVDPEFWKRFGPGAVGVGWDLALMGLHLHLETGAAVDPAEGQRFPLTPEGNSYVRTAATGWADAAIADGDDTDAARAAGAQTITFYTVEPESGS
ncbi:MAG: SRPBCC family protein [Nocardia sp.]|nr:SRPBCC family protein [Nocardia sp.]